ncbi:hypothetical protein N1851_023779 [Merluccius polli]|uniref:Uncharacterized protein n=1 Tax=Merluccius polli TaxID=89951 RepID=A0AA47MG86_MERPO|nr:hypothetical protein N1851_023779 [Merluccius polli]
MQEKASPIQGCPFEDFACHSLLPAGAGVIKSEGGREKEGQRGTEQNKTVAAHLWPPLPVLPPAPQTRAPQAHIFTPPSLGLLANYILPTKSVSLYRTQGMTDTMTWRDFQTVQTSMGLKAEPADASLCSCLPNLLPVIQYLSVTEPRLPDYPPVAKPRLPDYPPVAEPCCRTLLPNPACLTTRLLLNPVAEPCLPTTPCCRTPLLDYRLLPNPLPDYPPVAEPRLPDYPPVAEPRLLDYPPVAEPRLLTPRLLPNPPPAGYPPVAEPRLPDYPPVAEPRLPDYPPVAEPRLPDYPACC